MLKFFPVLQRGSLAVKRTNGDSFAQDLLRYELRWLLDHLRWALAQYPSLADQLIEEVQHRLPIIPYRSPGLFRCNAQRVYDNLPELGLS